MADMPENDKVRQFCDYLVDTYISEDAAFPPSMWGLPEEDHYKETTHACESFHAKFNNSFFHRHLIVFYFVDVLLLFQTETYIKMCSSDNIPPGLIKI